MKKMIVGLGNPGPQYRNTRHNMGFRAVDCLAERLHVRIEREKHEALYAETEYSGTRLLLVKPLTFMNRSGIAVAQFARNAVQERDDVLVVADDVHLALGRLRFRRGGSAGGHNGLLSVIEHLGTQEFARLRMGVGKDKASSALVDHVLGTFRPEEAPEVEAMVSRAADGLLRYVGDGIEAAMNACNADTGTESGAEDGGDNGE